MSDNNEATADGDGKASDGKNPLPRRVFGAQRHAPLLPTAPRSDLEAKLADIVDSVKVLQTHISSASFPGDSAADNDKKARGPKRFQRLGGDEAREAEGEPVLDHEVRGDEATLNKNIAWPRIARPEEAPASATEMAGAFVRRHPFIIWVLVQIAGFGLLLTGYLLGQSTPSGDEDRADRADSASQAKDPEHGLLLRMGVNDRVLEAASKALNAEKTGDLKAARDTYEAAVKGGLRMPGAEYRLAMLDMQRDDLTAADIHLSNSLASGEMMASCYFVNACFAGKNSNYVEAARQLALAVRVEPFNAKYSFCWGEALRRAGKTQAGIDALTQALNRPASPSDIELYTFKLRLAKVEAGHDEAFNTELTAHLAQSPTTGDWLLLAAAWDLTHGAFPTAVGHLKAAMQSLSPEVYNLLVQDFVFQGHVARPELSALLKVPPPPSSTVPLDPGAWPAEEADPAVWPPFSPTL